MTTLTMTPILSGCCGALYAMTGTDVAPLARCTDCLSDVDVVWDIIPNMGEGETLVSERHPSGVSVLGYTGGE